MRLRHLYNTKEDNAYDKFSDEHPYLKTALRFIPGVGQAIAAADVVSAASRGDAKNAAHSALGIIPGAAGVTAQKTANVAGAVSDYNQAVSDIEKKYPTKTALAPTDQEMEPITDIDETIDDFQGSMNSEQLRQMFKDFFVIAMSVLDLKKLPKIKLRTSIGDVEQPTFGRFMNDDLVIELGLKNRHPNDILRTLAHELVHFKQMLENRIGPNSGETGSSEENQANVYAGIIMRHFNKKYPKYLKSTPL